MKSIPLIAVLSFFILASSMAFAAPVEIVPNPSYESVRNLTLPAEWWECDASAGATIVCSSDEVSGFLSINDTSIEGSNSIKLLDDANGNAVSSTATAPNSSSLSGTYNWSILVNAGNGTDDGFNMWITNRTDTENPYWLYFEGMFVGGDIDYFDCIITNSSGQVPFSCSYQNMSDGWKKMSAQVIMDESMPEYFFAVEAWDNDALENYMLFDDFTLTYEQAATPPVVAIQNPAQDSVITLSLDYVTYALQYTAESASIDSCWYSLNGLPNVTMAGCANGTGYPNLNPYDLENQTVNSVTVYANDTSGNIGSATSTFNVSLEHPAVYIIVPNGNYNVDTVFFIQVPSGWRNTCGFRIDNESLNMSVGCTNANIWLPQGSHNITAQIWNYQDNYGNGTNSFFVDSIAPVVTVQNPTGSVSSPYNVNYVTDELNLDSCWYSTDDGSNTTIPSCGNFTDTAAVGSHNITVYANDTLGNIGSGTSAFSVSAPVVPPATGMVTGATAAVYMILPILLGLLIILAAIAMMMSGHTDIKEAAVMVIIGIIMIIAATSIMSSFL